jgi:hypothetical protein
MAGRISPFSDWSGDPVWCRGAIRLLSGASPALRDRGAPTTAEILQTARQAVRGDSVKLNLANTGLVAIDHAALIPFLRQHLGSEWWVPGPHSEDK